MNAAECRPVDRGDCGIVRLSGCPSFRLFPLYLRNRLTVDLELLHVSLQGIAGQAHRSTSKLWIRREYGWSKLDGGQFFLVGLGVVSLLGLMNLAIRLSFVRLLAFSPKFCRPAAIRLGEASPRLALSAAHRLGLGRGLGLEGLVQITALIDQACM